MFHMVHNSRKKKNTEVSTLSFLSVDSFLLLISYRPLQIFCIHTKLYFNIVDLRIFMTLSIPKFIELEFSVLSISYSCNSFLDKLNILLPFWLLPVDLLWFFYSADKCLCSSY